MSQLLRQKYILNCTFYIRLLNTVCQSPQATKLKMNYEKLKLNSMHEMADSLHFKMHRLTLHLTILNLYNAHKIWVMHNSQCVNNRTGTTIDTGGKQTTVTVSSGDRKCFRL